MIVADLDAAAWALGRFERSLDPAHPERSGADVLAYGEVSAALLLPDEPAVAGAVVKRMSGFADDAAVAGYGALVAEYQQRLTGLGVSVTPTVPVTVRVRGRRPVVYLLQRRLPTEGLGNRMVHTAGDDDLAALVTTALQQTLPLYAANAAHRDDEIAVDGQLSNWCFAPDPRHPVLIDVGTPFIRRAGRHAFDLEILLSAVPPGIRAFHRRKGSMGEYFDDYFEPRLLAVDLVGNLFKEQVPQRIPVALAAANDWLAGPAAALQDQLARPGARRGPITEDEVAQYYRADAATLELFLRVRRLDRAARRLLRQRYDFILPGRVAR